MMAASSVLLVASAPAPVVDSPYLSILINRRDLGSSFELGVDKANQNLVVSGPPAPLSSMSATPDSHVEAGTDIGNVHP